MGQNYLAIVNPAAAGGRTRKLLGPALQRLQAGGIKVDTAETRTAGQATEIARQAYGRGVRNFIAVGGDGTSYEIVNGLYPQALSGERPTLGFLPLGTGNSFLRDFSDQGVEYAIESLLAQRSRRRHPARQTLQRMGRAWLPGRNFSDSGSIQPAPFSGSSRWFRKI